MGTLQIQCFFFFVEGLVVGVFTVINDIETPSELVRFIQLPAKEEHRHTAHMILWRETLRLPSECSTFIQARRFTFKDILPTLKTVYMVLSAVLQEDRRVVFVIRS